MWGGLIDWKHYLSQNCCTYGCRIIESKHSELCWLMLFHVSLQTSTEGACGPSDQNGFGKKHRHWLRHSDCEPRRASARVKHETGITLSRHMVKASGCGSLEDMWQTKKNTDKELGWKIFILDLFPSFGWSRAVYDLKRSDFRYISLIWPCDLTKYCRIDLHVAVVIQFWQQRAATAVAVFSERTGKWVINPCIHDVLADRCQIWGLLESSLSQYVWVVHLISPLRQWT